jgi:quinol monooxygenase YgiN
VFDGFEIDSGFAVLIVALSFDVRPEHQREFVSAVTHVACAIRWAPGCLGCRLVADCESPTLFTLYSEWDGRPFLNRHLASPEFQVLTGTKFLLRSGPTLTIDEVVSYGRHPGPVRSLE